MAREIRLYGHTVVNDTQNERVSKPGAILVCVLIRSDVEKLYPA